MNKFKMPIGWSGLATAMVDADALLRKLDPNGDIASMDLEGATAVFDAMSDVEIFTLFDRKHRAQEELAEANRDIDAWFKRKGRLAAKITELQKASTERPEGAAIADQEAGSPAKE